MVAEKRAAAEICVSSIVTVAGAVDAPGEEGKTTVVAAVRRRGRAIVCIPHVTRVRDLGSFDGVVPAESIYDRYCREDKAEASRGEVGGSRVPALVADGLEAAAEEERSGPEPGSAVVVHLMAWTDQIEVWTWPDVVDQAPVIGAALIHGYFAVNAFLITPTANYHRMIHRK